MNMKDFILCFYMMRPSDAFTCYHALFVSVLWSHTGDHAPGGK